MDEALAGLRRSLGCARAPVSPTTCAAVHRAHAMRAFLDADEAAAIASLRAMLHADPRALLPREVVPDGHALEFLMLKAEESPTEWTRAPAGGWVLVDGIRTGAVPVGQPYLMQPIRGDGKAKGARLMRVIADGSAPLKMLRGGDSGPKRALRYTGVGLGVASAALYGGAWASNRAYHRAVVAEDNTRIGTLHGSTNLLSVTSVVAVGLGLGAVITAEIY